MQIGASELIGGLVFVLVIFVLGYVIYRSTKASADFGKSAVIYFVSQNTFWLFLITFVMMIAEAGLSSTFHPDGDKNALPIGIRFISHLGFAMTGWIMLINTGPRLIELVSFIEQEKEKGSKISRAYGTTLILKVFYVLVTFVFGVAIPLTNLYIVALGLEESIQFKFFVQDVILMQDLSGFYPRVPIETMETRAVSPNGYLPSDYDPFTDMSYPLQLMIITFVIQTILGIIKGVDISALYRDMYHVVKTKSVSDKKEVDKKEGEKKDESKKEPEKKSSPSIDNLLDYILVNVLLYDRSEIDSYISKGVSSFNTMSADNKTRLLTSLSAVKTKHVNLMVDPSGNAADIAALKEEAKRYLNNSIDKGGLSLALSSRRTT